MIPAAFLLALGVVAVVSSIVLEPTSVFMLRHPVYILFAFLSWVLLPSAAFALGALLFLKASTLQHS